MFNAVFNTMSLSMRTRLPDLTRIYLYQSFIKTAINTAITVKLLTSKVTLLNTCEKLKMTHEKQLELWNKKSKVNDSMKLVIVKHITYCHIYIYSLYRAGKEGSAFFQVYKVETFQT